MRQNGVLEMNQSGTFRMYPLLPPQCATFSKILVNFGNTAGKHLGNWKTGNILNVPLWFISSTPFWRILGFTGWEHHGHTTGDTAKYSLNEPLRNITVTFFGKLGVYPIHYLMGTSQSHDLEHCECTSCFLAGDIIGKLAGKFLKIFVMYWPGTPVLVPSGRPHQGVYWRKSPSTMMTEGNHSGWTLSKVRLLMSWYSRCVSTHIPTDKFETLCHIVADISAAPYTSKVGIFGRRCYSWDYDIILLVGLMELKAQIHWIDSRTVRTSAKWSNRCGAGREFWTVNHISEPTVGLTGGRGGLTWQAH